MCRCDTGRPSRCARSKRIELLQFLESELSTPLRNWQPLEWLAARHKAVFTTPALADVLGDCMGHRVVVREKKKSSCMSRVGQAFLERYPYRYFGWFPNHSMLGVFSVVHIFDLLQAKFLINVDCFFKRFS